MDEKEFVFNNYSKYVEEIAGRYLVRLTRSGYLISAVNNMFFNGRLLKRNFKMLLGKHLRLAIQNCLQCEVHNEVLQTYLNNRNCVWVEDCNENIGDKHK